MLLYYKTHWETEKWIQYGYDHQLAVHYTVLRLGALVSWGLTISQNEPNAIPNAPQKIPIVIIVTNLKFMSMSDDIVISSGLAGNTTNAKVIITA